MRINTLNTWKLPQPLDLKENNEWVAIPRIARTVPFGYELDEEDDKVLLPVKKELDLLEKARQHVKKYSFREVSAWLSANSGRYISHVGLRKRLANERRRKNKAASYRKWASYAQEALSKADALEKARTGAAVKPATDTDSTNISSS